MTKETFEKLLEDNDITWNDIVIIHVLNPNFRWSLFKKYPKIISFKGALGYTKKQNYINQIIGIERTTV